MTQKMYFLAEDNHNPSSYDSLWVTDGTTTEEVGGIGNSGVSGSGDQGLEPDNFAVFDDGVIFAGLDASGLDNSNIWTSDGTVANTKEIGGVSNGTTSPFADGDPANLGPIDFLTFDYGEKALFTATNAAKEQTLWVTNGDASGTQEVGGFSNGQVANRDDKWQPYYLTAFNSVVLFDARDKDGYIGLWSTDGTQAGTQEIGGLKNQSIYGSTSGDFAPTNFIQLGDLMLFTASDSGSDTGALWITDGTASGTVEIGGLGNIGVPGADKDVGLGGGLANAVAFGARVFFKAATTAALRALGDRRHGLGTIEVGGAANGGVPGSVDENGLDPTHLAVDGQLVLFNGRDGDGDRTLWATDGTATGTHEIGGSVPLLGEASDGLDPDDFVALGNGKAVFIGDDSSSDGNSGKPTLWVTDGTTGGTQEIGGLDNQTVSGISTDGFSFNPIQLIGGDGLAYFVGEDSSDHFVLWGDGRNPGGTKVVTAAGQPATGLSPEEMIMGPVPAAENTVSGGGKTVNLDSVPGEALTISSTNNVPDTVTGSNGILNMIAAQAAAVGGGLLISLLNSAVTLSNTKGNADTVSFKGAGGSSVTLNGAQANVVGGGETITFATGTTGNYVYIRDTNGNPDTVNGSNGTIVLDNAQANIAGGDDVIKFWAGTTDLATLSGTGANWDSVYSLNGTTGLVRLNVAEAKVYSTNIATSFWGGSTNAVNYINTGSVWDAVSNANNATGTVYLTTAWAQVTGAGDTIEFWGGSNDAVQIVNSQSAWTAVKALSGSSGKVYLTNALAQVTGAGDSIYFWGGTANGVQLINSTGAWTSVSAASGSSGTVYLTSAWAQVTGVGDTIEFYNGSNDAVQLVNAKSSWTAVNAASGSTGSVYLTSAFAQVTGGGDQIYFWGGSGDGAQLINTNNVWDNVSAASGSTGTVYLTSALAQVTGGGDTINFWGGSNDAASLVNTGSTWDTVGALSGSKGSVYLTNALAQITGGGDNVVFNGGSGDVALLVNTAGAADNVTAASGVSGSVYLSNASASITGSGDAVDFYAGTNNVANVSGSHEAFVLNSASYGLDTVSGYNATDSLSFATADQGHLTVAQVGADTKITLDANDVLTLSGYLGAVSIGYHS